MIYVKMIGHNYIFELKEIIFQYFHKDSIKFLHEEDCFNVGRDYLIIIAIEKKYDYYDVYTVIEIEGKEITKSKEQIPNIINSEKEVLYKLKVTLYNAMKSGFGHILPWGILTGIRPSKIVHKLIDQGYDENKIITTLNNHYLLSKEKTDLLINVVKNQRDIIYPIKKKSISLYIGIPFCPSRCIYCSFLSSVLEKDKGILKEYLDSLFFEIKEISKYIQKNNLKIETIYIGGGTPTILNQEELNSLLYLIAQEINIKNIKEYTLEAGRPDTINKKKLKLSLQYGINRISINPQTMDNNTLIKIGRNHSSEDIIRAFNLAREVGFNFINMDLILGLPGEDKSRINNTLAHIKSLQPENLTIHIMSLKRGSKLSENINNYNFDQGKNILEMQETTRSFALNNGYQPYYLYRQKYMLGNLENIGYCKNGYRSIYNILIMSEKQTILGLGAGSVTKVFFPEEDRIERFPNVKDVRLYNNRIRGIIDKKLLLLDSLYSKNY